MYRKIEDFLADWQEEAKMTIKVFQNIDEKLANQKVNDNVRSLKRLAWHLTETLTNMPHQAGVLDTDQLAQHNEPLSMSEICQTYQQHSDQLHAALDKMSDVDLEKEANMYGEVWPLGLTLSILVKHQAHHRGQMTAIMRFLGSSVPGVYGPSKEEWVNYNMPAME